METPIICRAYQSTRPKYRLLPRGGGYGDPASAPVSLSRLTCFPPPRVARQGIMHNIKLCQQYDQVQATPIQPPSTRSWRLIGAHTGRSKGHADVRCRTAALEPQERSDRRATARSIHPSALASKVTHGPEARSHPAMPASNGTHVWFLQRAVNALRSLSAQLPWSDECVFGIDPIRRRRAGRKSKALALGHCCFIAAWDIAALTGTGDDHSSFQLL